jgi:dCTP deaminase
MLITYNGLVKLVEQGVIENVDPACINGASIDIHLGDNLMTEARMVHTELIDLANKETPKMVGAPLVNEAWNLYPGDFVLANTREVFHLPDDIAFEVKLKSSGARAGLEHALAGWADPGFNNATLTLELRNVLKYHALQLRPGMKIAQIVLWRGEPVPADHSYRVMGRYNGQKDATPSQGL